jgi:hypothetical protein
VISKESARTGLPVLKKNGRFIDSSIDPAREALAWVEKQAPVGQLVGQSVGQLFDQWIVLGIGSGYHVAALVAHLAESKISQPILVIDNDNELVDAAKIICPSLSACKIVVETDWRKLVDNVDFCDAVGSVYKICEYGPSFQIDPVYFKAVHSLLRGREKVSFLHLLKTRPDLLSSLNPQAILKLPDEPVSVRTMCDLFSEQAFSSRERRLWRILEELIV